MSQLPGEPDPVVRTALALLPVPDHRDRFWDELHDRLDAEPAPGREVPRSARPERRTQPVAAGAAAGGRPATVLELAPDRSTGLVPPALRRRSNVVLTAVAAAAAVMVVVAGAALVRQRAEGRVGTTGVADGPTEEQTLISSTSTSTSVAGPEAEGPKDAVMAWLTDLAEGDTASAWDALGPGSQAHFGSRSAFAAQGSSLAEGYGAWASAQPDDVLVTALGPGGSDDVVVVTLVGTVAQEGTRQHRADAFPVRMVDGVPRLEPYAFAGELEIVVPEGVPAGGTRPIVPTDQDIVIVVPRGVEAPVLRLDDGDVVVCGQSEGTELTELDDAPGQRCSYHPEGGLEPGTRVLTVAFTNPDRTGIAAASVLFEAA